MRQLSAIMFTDMVGYSALSQQNEALALDLLEEHRKILRPIFAKHNGREIETAGDAFFVEFHSAVEATECAIEIQTAMHERNKKEPKERHVLLRIGLHIGDVVYMGDNVYGDGVNIAARMEPLAPHGGICVSEDVARQIRNKVVYPIVKLRKEKLKNITLPMEVYCIMLPWLSDRKTRRKSDAGRILTYALALLGMGGIIALLFFLQTDHAEAHTTHSRLRLAVLPFTNISNNQSDEYFADGMTEELISGLSKISGLNVIARTSVMKYKTTDKGITEIGGELMVGSILEGSVRKAENKARITVQLIDVSTQEHIWSMEYDRDLKDIFMTQSEIAQSVANELKVRLVSSEKEQLEKSKTDNRIAFEEYLLGKHFLNQRTSETIQTAIIHFENSVKEDSSFALPYASLAYCYTLTGVAGYGNTPRVVAEAKAKDAGMKAIELDEALAEAHAALGYIKFRFDWDWKNAEKEFKRAIELQPGDATAHEWYALFLAINRRLDEALKEMETAYQLDPLSSSVNTGLGRIYHFRDENDKAIAQFNKTLRLDPNYAEAHFSLGMTYTKIKEYEHAIAELKTAIDLSNRRPVIVGVLGATYAQQGRIDEAMRLLKELEMPPMNNDKLYASAIIKSNTGQTDDAVNVYTKLINEKYGIMVYMNVQRELAGKIDPGKYRQMLSKMGF